MPKSSVRTVPAFAGRSLGQLIVVSIQSLIGTIHLSFGLWLLFVSPTNLPYSIYTTVFGGLTLLFVFGLWMRKNWGWLGTVSTLLFVTVADTLALLNLPSIPGIPEFAAFAEITYSLILLTYLSQSHVTS